MREKYRIKNAHDTFIMLTGYKTIARLFENEEMLITA
jgi:hypothetical protein